MQINNTIVYFNSAWVRGKGRLDSVASIMHLMPAHVPAIIPGAAGAKKCQPLAKMTVRN